MGSRLLRSVVALGALLMLGSWVAGPAAAQNLPHIRWGYVLPPIAEIASIFDAKPELTKHLGKSYTYQSVYVRGSPNLVRGLAAGEIDVANLGFSTFHQAVVNAGLADMRVIADEVEDGFHGYFSSQIRVRKDSGINKVEDLKGKVVATIALGSAADMLTRYTLLQHGLKINKDYTMIETPFPTMKAMLLEKKVDAAYFAQPFASDPEVDAKTKVLFTTDDSMGPLMPNFVAARGSFISKNRAAMVDFLEDFLRVVRWYYDPANYDEAVKIISKASKTPEAVLKRYIFTKRDNYRNLDGLPDLAVIQRNMEEQHELGFTDRVLDIKKYADLSLIKEAAARLKK
jgi:NitT/TauT family transport system substrate-binding protein